MPAERIKNLLYKEMNKTFLLTVTLAGASGVVFAGANQSRLDTTKVVELQNVEVLGTRATQNTPVAFSEITKQQLNRVNHGQDIPFLLSTMPSVLTTSDAGTGVGYTSIRVRGTDATRINVTANDIPMNDAESQALFWVDMPDFASNLRDIQVQRGVGTSTNGAGAFGATVNMRTQSFSMIPGAEISGSYGSYNTNKETVKFGTGLLGGHWVFDGRLSHISSDGYRDRAATKMWSYFDQAGYFYNTGSLRFISFGGRERTYHAWDGISQSKLETDRTYNPNGEIKDDNGHVVGFYKNQNDYYDQFNFQLIWAHNFNALWHLNVAGHYTDGYGYYEEYKNKRTLEEYALKPFYIDGTKVKKSDLIRQKIVDSGFGGGVFSLRYTGDRLAATLGGGVNRYANTHHGEVIWVKNYVGDLAPNHEYYRNKSRKTDLNFYLKGDYRIVDGLNAFADLQYRYVNYTIDGENDNWDWTATPGHMQALNIDDSFNFFNPKVGLRYDINRNHAVYASFSVGHKEPTRNNYTDGLFNVTPKSERLMDYELGYNLRSERFSAGLNFYYMKYKDQLVLNGKLNEIGEPMAENVPDSYRMGVELTAGVKFTDWLRWDINGTLSKNKIKDYVGYVSDFNADTWDDLYTQTAIEKGTTTIAFSPTFMGNSVLAFDYKGFQAQYTLQYVSRQYLDNFENKDDSLDPYCVSHLNLAYTFHLPSMKALTLGCTIYNLFNTKYETNGYSQTVALYKNGDKNNAATLASDPRFYPMAGTNVLAHVTFRF